MSSLQSTVNVLTIYQPVLLRLSEGLEHLDMQLARNSLEMGDASHDPGIIMQFRPCPLFFKKKPERRIRPLAKELKESQRIDANWTWGWRSRRVYATPL